MIRIGLVGIGFMGMIHYLAAGHLRGARVTARCSRDRKKLAGDWTGIRGNFGPAGTHMDLGDVRRYEQFDQVADPRPRWRPGRHLLPQASARTLTWAALKFPPRRLLRSGSRLAFLLAPSAREEGYRTPDREEQ
jgi:hypothetical protein